MFLQAVQSYENYLPPKFFLQKIYDNKNLPIYGT